MTDETNKQPPKKTTKKKATKKKAPAKALAKDAALAPAAVQSIAVDTPAGKVVSLVPMGNLTPKQVIALPMLAKGETGTHTAKALGVTEKTISAWIHKNPEFNSALSQLRQTLADTINTKMFMYAANVTDDLYDLAKSGTPADQVKLAAIKTILAAGGFDKPQPTPQTTQANSEEGDPLRAPETDMDLVMAGLYGTKTKGTAS